MSEHAIREYLKTIGNGGGGVSEETDPVFTASPAHGISAQDIADWNDKQDELVSGTNIKTINGASILGSGDLPVAPPVTSTDVPTADTISEFDSDAHMNSTDMTTGSGGEVETFINGLNGGAKGINFHIVEGSSASFTISALNTKWITVPVPSGQGTPIAITGYFIQNGWYLNVYNLTLNGTTEASVALYNPSTSATGTIVFKVYFLMI